MSDNESEEFEDTDPLDKFIFDNGDNIIDLHMDLKSRVPYFFGDTCIPIYNLILDQYERKLIKPPFYNFYYEFYNEYKNVIQATLPVINTFLHKRKCKEIDINNWIVFCYNTTFKKS